MAIPFVIVELISRRVDEIKALGFPIIFGDAGKEIILEAVEIKKAKLLLITTPITIVSQAIVSQARKLNPDIHIIARAEGLEQMQDLHDLGVAHVIQPEFEASLEFAHQALVHLNISPDQIQSVTDEVRNELYS
jgi:CPA2 family monovalent cation:H+ antiporter-2